MPKYLCKSSPLRLLLLSYFSFSPPRSLPTRFDLPAGHLPRQSIQQALVGPSHSRSTDRNRRDVAHLTPFVSVNNLRTWFLSTSSVPEIVLDFFLSSSKEPDTSIHSNDRPNRLPPSQPCRHFTPSFLIRRTSVCRHVQP